MTQRAFNFDEAIATMRWKLGWLTVRWDNGIRGYFQDWPTALSCVLHPNNAHVRLRIRR